MTLDSTYPWTVIDERVCHDAIVANRAILPQSDKTGEKKDPAASDAIKNDVPGRIQVSFGLMVLKSITRSLTDSGWQDAAQEYQNEAGSSQYEADSSQASFYQSGKPTCEIEKRVILRYGHLAKHWRIGSVNGQSITPPSAQQFNDLDVLDHTYVVTYMTVWHDKQRLVGIQLLYQNGQVIFHGVKDPFYQSISLNMDAGGRRNPERVNLVWLEAHEDEAGSAWVDAIRVITTHDLLAVEPSNRLTHNKSLELRSAKPKSSTNWDFKGFYGSFDPTHKAFAQLSPIWGQTVVESPAEPKAMPLFEPAAWSSVLNWPIAMMEGLNDHVHKSDAYRFSHPRGNLTNTTGKLFNALNVISASWVIRKVYFYFNDLGDMSVLSGVSVFYHNDQHLQYGLCGSEMSIQSWEPSKKENERLVAVSTCFLDRPGQAQCSLGLRLFFETEEEQNKEPATENKTAEPAQASPPKEKIIKKSDLWLAGSMGHREHGFWNIEAASPSPSRDNPSEKWTVRGFMGQAGSDGIETIAVVWGKN